MNRKDLQLAGVLGLLSAIIFLVAYRVTGHALPPQFWSLLLGAPAAFICGLMLSFWLGRFQTTLYDLGKFVAVGIFNTSIDFGIFNILIAISGDDKGHWLVLFKSISFAAALVNSYFWNKFWTFRAENRPARHKEFALYVTVTLIGFLINVGATAVIANYIQPLGNLSQVQWDNAAAVVATAASLLWNFFGYKLIVFRAPSGPAKQV